jgi:aspartate/tyrosine/aromatic aminotransferase
VIHVEEKFSASGVASRANELRDGGADVNQVADILARADRHAANYGIGIILDGFGRPMPTSPELVAQTLRASNDGIEASYLSSKPLQAELLQQVLSWQRIPESYWQDFLLVTPSDAGTGAVNTAVQLYLMMNEQISALAVEELSWPVYQSIAASNRVGFASYALQAEDILRPTAITIMQAGPHNSTGYICSSDIIQTRADAAARKGLPIILDRAYPGFENAEVLQNQGYDAVMQRSSDHYLLPFLQSGCSVSIALSPTKAFRSFALRPCGLTLVYEPDANKRKLLESAMITVNRSRGSAFEHPATRGFIRGLVENRSVLELEHGETLQRLAQAQKLWKELLQGHPLAEAFTSQYAGMFRNLFAIDGCEEAFYEAHIYPVIAGNRCRINVTGIPQDEAKAQGHIDVFAKLLRL